MNQFVTFNFPACTIAKKNTRQVLEKHLFVCLLSNRTISRFLLRFNKRHDELCEFEKMCDGKQLQREKSQWFEFWKINVLMEKGVFLYYMLYDFYNKIGVCFFFIIKFNTWEFNFVIKFDIQQITFLYRQFYNGRNEGRANNKSVVHATRRTISFCIAYLNNLSLFKKAKLFVKESGTKSTVELLTIELKDV